jgi:protoporphyrinogen/coproporphyrinogen III oxidase
MTRLKDIDVAVVGAGVAGLITAFRVQKAGKAVVVLEGSERVGGAIETVREGGFTFELGPTFLSATASNAAELAQAAGLDAPIEATSAARRREVWTGEKLGTVPENPLDLLTTSLLSTRAKLRLMREPWADPPPAGDESVADFARRRLGDEVARLALAPVVAGMWAGDAERLSARHAFPELWEMERRHGSLLSGLRARGGEPLPRHGAWSFTGGMEALPRGLARQLDVRLGSACSEVAPVAGGYRVSSAGGAWRARHVVLACPAFAVAEALSRATGGESEALAEISYAPVAVVGVGIDALSVAHPLDALGFLAPRDAGLRLLGCLYPSALFPDRGPRGSATLVAILGGATDPGLVRWSAARLIEAVLEDLRRALGLRGELRAKAVRRMPRALPQYEIGHGRFLDLADRLERELPGVYLAGSYRGGISLGDCLARGEDVARRILGPKPQKGARGKGRRT